ncbi:8453_t:CDS:2, partial [Gigaspora rosea]
EEVWNNPAFSITVVWHIVNKLRALMSQMWETLDGLAYVNKSCRPKSNQFSIVGIQVVGEVIYLNVIVKDANGIPRYFHLDRAEIPLTMDTPWQIKALIHYY